MNQLTDQKLVLSWFILYDEFSWKLIVFSQVENTSYAQHPDDIDCQREAEEQDLALFPIQINRESSSKVIEEVTVGNEDWDGAEDNDDGDGGADTPEDGHVGDEGGDHQYDGPLL